MRLVIVESPYAGDVQGNVLYARHALLDSIRRGEAPLASHLLYPQVLDDTDDKDRHTGMQIGYEWMRVADAVVFYVDRGWSPGMIRGLKMARILGRKIETRSILSMAHSEPTPETPLDVQELLKAANAIGIKAYYFGDDDDR